ncbi:MAG: hypothetical protein HC797_09280 [Anaerolineales bacterium]|nr:hypothetical protein [Anaerolineales bacterium]
MKKQTLILLASIFLLAVILRLAGITARLIWYDEAFSILFAEKGLSAMLYGTLTPTPTGSADIHPLGYYTLLWGWINLFGRSIISARISSIISSLLSLVLVYKIADKLFNQKLPNCGWFIFYPAISNPFCTRNPNV